MKRVVRFSEECTIHEGYELAPEERAAVFYSGQDILEIKRRIQVAILLKDREMKMMGMSSRGLEKVCESQTEVEQKKAFTKDFSALQQDLKLRQVDANEREESLRSFAANRSKVHLKEAVRLAKKDEAAARRVYRDDNIRWTPPDSNKTKRNFRGKRLFGSLVRGLKLTREACHS